MNDEERVRGLVDPKPLARWMDERGLPGRGEPVAVRYVTGGASNELFEIRRGAFRCALRRPPRVVPEGRNDSMLREHRMLSALADTDVPHARVFGACDDPSVLGGCFYLMEYVDGWSVMSSGGWPAPFDTDLDARRGLAYELVDTIARLSRIDWQSKGLQGFGKPEGFHDRQVDRWLSHWERFRFRDIPGIDEAAAWLRGHRPRDWRPGIIHGDYGFANVMFRHGAPARMAAIVDWEMTTIGDPLLDLGWVLMGWPNPGEPRSRMAYVDHTGMPRREELLERYATRSGLQVDGIDYYVILARFKIAIVLEGGYARYVKGGADNPKMAAFGDVVLDMARKAAELAHSTPLRS